MSKPHITTMWDSPKGQEAERELIISWLECLMKIKFEQAQKPLGQPFQNVLDDNRRELYER